jgi:hypothetical protein
VRSSAHGITINGARVAQGGAQYVIEHCHVGQGEARVWGPTEETGDNRIAASQRPVLPLLLHSDGQGVVLPRRVQHRLCEACLACTR